MSNVMSIGYKDTDKKFEIDIYGIRFEINAEKINEKKVNNIEDINKNDNIEKEIEDIIGEGAIDRLNKQREKDGYAEMTIDVQIQVLKFIYISYVKAVSNGMMEDINKTIEEEKGKISNVNRAPQRNYNRNYRRRNYRRY